jgi:hypothetical protein
MGSSGWVQAHRGREDTLLDPADVSHAGRLLRRLLCRIFDYAGDGWIGGGPGADKMEGYEGNDTIDAGDGTRDERIVCGSGTFTVYFDKEDIDSVNPSAAKTSTPSGDLTACIHLRARLHASPLVWRVLRSRAANALIHRSAQKYGILGSSVEVVRKMCCRTHALTSVGGYAAVVA